MNRPFAPLDPRQVARALGGKAYGDTVRAPGPGHSLKDDSLSVLIGPEYPDGFWVHSFAGDDPLKCRDFVNGKLERPAWSPSDKVDTPADIIERMKAAYEARRKRTKFSDRQLIRDGYRHVATYDYSAPDGEPLYQVLRYEHD